MLRTTESKGTRAKPPLTKKQIIDGIRFHECEIIRHQSQITSLKRMLEEMQRKEIDAYKEHVSALQIALHDVFNERECPGVSFDSCFKIVFLVKDTAKRTLREMFCGFVTDGSLTIETKRNMFGTEFLEISFSSESWVNVMRGLRLTRGIDLSEFRQTKICRC